MPRSPPSAFLPPPSLPFFGIKDEMKPKYHALLLAILHRITSGVSLLCRHIASTLTSSAAKFYYPLSLSSPLLSLLIARKSVLLARKAAKNSPVIESILCKPINGPSPRTTPSSFALSHFSPSYHPSPRFAIYGA